MDFYYYGSAEEVDCMIRMREKTRSVFMLLLGGALAVLLVGAIPLLDQAGDESTYAYAVAAKTKATVAKKTVVQGDSFSLRGAIGGHKATWRSSDKKVAVVSKAGKVKAKRTGKVTITAKAGNRTYRWNITVVKKLSKVRLKSATYGNVSGNPYQRELKVTWKKVPAAKGYQVAVKWGESAPVWINGQKHRELIWEEKWTTMGTMRSTSYHYKTEDGVKYSYAAVKVKVRAYYSVGGKRVYGKWSTAKALGMRA